MARAEKDRRAQDTVFGNGALIVGFLGSVLVHLPADHKV